jgi:hypothetical protein
VTRPCGLCGAPDARLYISGWCCPTCTPAARSGRSEPGQTASQYQPQRYPDLRGVDPWHVVIARFEASKRRAENARDQARPVHDLQLPEVS